MTHSIDAALIVVTVSALLYIALGIWVLTLKPRRRQTLLLGAFAILFGLPFAVWDVAVPMFHAVDLDPGVAFLVLWIPFGVLAWVTALALAASAPGSLGDRSVLAGAVATGLVFAVAAAYTGSFPTPPGLYGTLYLLGFGVVATTATAASVLLALRADPRRGVGATETTQIAILAVAFALLDAFVAGMTVPHSARLSGTPLLALLSAEGTTVSPVAWVAVIGLWIRNMVRADEETVRTHRGTLLAILGLLTAGGLYQAAFPSAEPGTNVMRGVMRTLGVALLAYGVLRHDLAGLDAKVEWGVSRTTVAGIFVAVFFIAGELAETFFGDVFGPYVGVIAAGLLVFAISPLQRLADRFAAKAVPDGSPVGAASGEAGAKRPEELYRFACEKAYADGGLSREEELELAEMADRLGVPGRRAMEIRREVAEEGSGGGEA